MRDLVILLHGAWAGAWVWDRIAPALATAGWATLAPDLPGNGADGRGHGEVTFDDHIAHVETLVLAADTPVRIVAHSGAGVLATALAERHPDRVAGITGICAMLLPSGVTFPEFIAPFAADNPAAHGITPWLQDVDDGTCVPPDFATTIFFHDAPEDTARTAAARLSAHGHAVRAPRVTWTADRAGTVPVGYIRCDADRSVLPSVQDAMCATRPGARVTSLPTGHAPMLADPAALTWAMLDLLEMPG